MYVVAAWAASHPEALHSCRYAYPGLRKVETERSGLQALSQIERHLFPHPQGRACHSRIEACDLRSKRGLPISGATPSGWHGKPVYSPRGDKSPQAGYNGVLAWRLLVARQLPLSYENEPTRRRPTGCSAQLIILGGCHSAGDDCNGREAAERSLAARSTARASTQVNDFEGAISEGN